MPTHLKKSFNQAHFESGTYEQIVSHPENVLELNGRGAPYELQINTVMQETTQQNSKKPKPTCHHCQKPGHYWIETKPTQTIQILKKTEDIDLSTHLVRRAVRLTTPRRNVILEKMQRIDHLPGIGDQKDKTKSNREMLKTVSSLRSCM